MNSQGTLAPETHEEAREAFERVGPVAQQVVRETARAMAFTPAEYDERVTADVVQTARDVLFAAELQVHSGSRAEFEEWCADRDHEVVEVGSPNVDNLVWHAAPFVSTVVAASYQDEREAAVEILRRQALGRIYRVELDGMEGAAATDSIERETETETETGTETETDAETEATNE